MKWWGNFRGSGEGCFGVEGVGLHPLGYERLEWYHSQIYLQLHKIKCIYSYTDSQRLMMIYLLQKIYYHQMNYCHHSMIHEGFL